MLFDRLSLGPEIRRVLFVLGLAAVLVAAGFALWGCDETTYRTIREVACKNPHADLPECCGTLDDGDRVKVLATARVGDEIQGHGKPCDE